MGVADFQCYELLAFEFGSTCGGGGFDGGAIADADEAEDGGVAFGDAEDVVVEVGACCAWRCLSTSTRI